jgi:hypothetical protein
MVIGAVPFADALKVTPPDTKAVVDTLSGSSVTDGGALIVKGELTALTALLAASLTRTLRFDPGEFATVQ